jgi:phage head maturation protease
VSGVRCGGCGAPLRYAGEPCYTCSPQGWMADYQRRRRGESQNDGLGRAWASAAAVADRRRASRGTYGRIRAESADEAAVAQYRRDRAEAEAVIARAQARSRGAAAPEISRAAALAYARSPGRDQCSGPDCPVCAYGRQLDAARGDGEIIRRVCPVEDIRIIRRAQGGDGRTVEAYAAVFDQRAEIADSMGRYTEVIDRHAFDERLAEARRARGGLAAEVTVMFNHSTHRDGSPSDRWLLPVGKPLDIRPDGRGLLTITRYSDTSVLDKIKAGELTSQSFVGACLRSDPELRRGRRYGQDGRVPVVRRMALGLKEYGPVLWPAYPGAEILGVRSE